MSSPTGDGGVATDDYQTLIQFLYRAPIGLVEITPDGSISMINPMAAQLLMPLSASGGLDNLFDVLAEVSPGLRSLAGATAEVGQTLCDGLRLVLQDRATRRDGGPEILALTLIRLDQRRCMAVLLDATADAQREQRRLRRASRTDALTCMPNRAAAREQVAAALARARAEPDYRFAVLFMNCDRFKLVNDAVGNAGGDAVLGLLAGRLRAVLRDTDSITRTRPVSRHTPNAPHTPHTPQWPQRPQASPGNEALAARVGGDEFVVLLHDLQCPADAEGVAARLLDALSRPYVWEEQRLHCSVSIGLLLQPNLPGDADGVLHDAGLAMSEAKRRGGGRCVEFDRGMQQRAQHRGTLEAELRTALAEQQLFVVYQPVIAMANDAVASVEALVRWRHPVRGTVPPIEFIGIAEESGLIGALGDFVLAHACRQFMQWQRDHGDGAPRTLAVNLSRAQLAQPGLVDGVRQTLVSCGMPAAQLQLEVTESLAAQDESVQKRLMELKALGLTLALDDFGTGYSSLASLHQLPVDTVKIDRSFVSQIEASRHHQVLVDATIRVAQSLGMGTVAEGIETRAQADALRKLGCDKGQGYFFARPLTAAQIDGWLAERVRAAGEAPAGERRVRDVALT